MLNKRKRAVRCQEETAAQLFEAYKAERVVSRYGSHSVLRWLVISQQYNLLDHTTITCPMSAANIEPKVLSIQECRKMEQAVVTLAEAADKKYICYAAAFFKWWFNIAEMIKLPQIYIDPQHTTCGWLSTRNIERSLVVPDVRRAAIKIAQVIQVRAGERESMDNKSISSLLQVIRTGEWNQSLQQTLMYGTATEIYHKGLLNAVYIAIIDGRYTGRLHFEWFDKVICTPARPNALGAWPVIYVHGNYFVVIWNKKHVLCANAYHAYCAWLYICIQDGGTVAGRYNVSKCM